MRRGDVALACHDLRRFPGLCSCRQCAPYHPVAPLFMRDPDKTPITGAFSRKDAHKEILSALMWDIRGPGKMPSSTVLNLKDGRTNQLLVSVFCKFGLG